MRVNKAVILVTFLLILFSVTAFSLCGSNPDPGVCPPCLANHAGHCCGDGACTIQLGETCTTCPTDCAPCPSFCGDGRCDPGAGETSITCRQDCSSCGDGFCNNHTGTEMCQTCQGDCRECPSCTLENADRVCAAALTPEQINCTFYYCDPNDGKCVYNQASYTGKPCGNERAPYSDECHVDVCIGGLCTLNATIISGDILSGGGMPPLINPSTPWMKGECVYNSTINDYAYNESPIHPFCGHWGCEAALGETNMTCCEDCNCTDGYMCVSGSCRLVSNSTVVAFSTDWQNWTPLVAVALIFGYLLAALVYMVSHVIGSPELEAWSKNEIYETSVSALFVGSAAFFVGLMTALSVNLIGIGYEQAADNYVHYLAGELMRIYGLTIKGVFAMGLLGYVGGQMALPVVITGIVNVGLNGSIYPFGGMGLISNTLIMFSNVLSFAIMAVIAQKVVLDFILDVGFRIVLPIAVFLRCFTFTRKIGATLMAVAIGAYIVYPVTLMMNAQIYGSVPKIPQSEYHSSAFPLDKFDIGPWMDLFLGPNFGKWCKHWYDWLWMCWLFAIFEWVVNFVVAIFQAMALIIVVLAQVMHVGVAEVTAGAFDYYVNMIPWAMQPITAALLFPVFDLIVVITAIRSLSEAIGGESRITGLAQFI